MTLGQSIALAVRPLSRSTRPGAAAGAEVPAGAPPGAPEGALGTLSPPVARPAVESVLGHYEAGQLIAATPVAEGLLNRGYRVVTSTGTYFLKCYVERATATRAALTTQHRATTALQAIGLPAVPPLPDREGRTVACYGGRRFALFRWIEGCHRTGAELTLAQCSRLGELLGRIHLGLERVCPPAVQPRGHETADPLRTEELIADLLLRIRAQTHGQDFDRLALRRLTERRVLLAAYGHRRPAPDAAPPTGWVHGDFHGLNLLYGTGTGTDTVAAVVDWDRLGLKPRAEEMIRSATLIFNDPVSGVLDLPRVRRYAQAYLATGVATGADLVAAVHRVWWERLNDFWMLQWRYQRADHRADPLFPAASAQIGWWCATYEEVLAAFAG